MHFQAFQASNNKEAPQKVCQLHNAKSNSDKVNDYGLKSVGAVYNAFIRAQSGNKSAHDTMACLSVAHTLRNTFTSWTMHEGTKPPPLKPIRKAAWKWENVKFVRTLQEYCRIYVYQNWTNRGDRISVPNICSSTVWKNTPRFNMRLMTQPCKNDLAWEQTTIWFWKNAPWLNVYPMTKHANTTSSENRWACEYGKALLGSTCIRWLNHANTTSP